jgi:hypothetical protein
MDSVSVCRFKELLSNSKRLYSKYEPRSMHVDTIPHYGACSLSLCRHFLLPCYILRYDVRSKYFYVCSWRSHIHIYIAEAGFINIHPTLSAATHSFHTLHLVPSSQRLIFVSVCLSPLQKDDAREEVNLRILGDVWGQETGGGVVFGFTPLSVGFPSFSQHVFFLQCPFYFPYFFCVFLFHFCNLKEEDLK